VTEKDITDLPMLHYSTIEGNFWETRKKYIGSLFLPSLEEWTVLWVTA